MATEANHLNTRLESKTFPIFLRTIELRDAAHHAALLSNPDKPLDADWSASVIPKQRDSANTPTVLSPDGSTGSGPGRVNMVICLKTAGGDEEVIGLGGYGAMKDWERDGRKIRAGDVGVLLDKAHRGKGYGLEAMKLAMDWGFSSVSEGGPQLDIVTITTEEDNAPMIKMIDGALGLKGKGILRPAEFDNTKQELYVEIKPEEWKAK